jgi:hypothetical protein
MKKFFVMFAIAGALVACNDNASNTDATADSIRIADSIRREDSIRNANAAPVMPDSATMQTPDTAKMHADTAKH